MRLAVAALAVQQLPATDTFTLLSLCFHIFLLGYATKSRCSNMYIYKKVIKIRIHVSILNIRGSDASFFCFVESGCREFA